MNLFNQMFFLLAQVNVPGNGAPAAKTAAKAVSTAAKAGHHAAGQQGNPIYSLVLIVVMILVFWLLLIRPQQKQRKKQEAFLNAIKIGDQVYTGSGIIGRITAMDESLVTLEIAKDTRIKVIKSQIGGYYKPGEKPRMDSDKR